MFVCSCQLVKAGMPSLEMLSVCFNNLFARLPSGSVNLEALLQLWLTLNDDTVSICSEANGGALTFDTSRVPSISLDMAAVSGLLATLVAMPSIPLRVWVLAFQTLSLVANLRCNDAAEAAGGGGGSERWIATAMIANSNLDAVLEKFLTDAPAAASGNSMHVSYIEFLL
jgi:baculoviral IAP repeat-containing protein 6